MLPSLLHSCSATTEISVCRGSTPSRLTHYGLNSLCLRFAGRLAGDPRKTRYGDPEVFPPTGLGAAVTRRSHPLVSSSFVTHMPGVYSPADATVDRGAASDSNAARGCGLLSSRDTKAG